MINSIYRTFLYLVQYKLCAVFKVVYVRVNSRCAPSDRRQAVKEDSQLLKRTLFMSLQDHLDHVASRVVTVATYRGAPIGRTAALTSVSWGMAATACFSVERLTSVVFASFAIEENVDDRSAFFTFPRHSISSHLVGGAVGGGFVGLLYGNKPLQGALFLTPVLGVIGFVQQFFEDEQRGRDFQSR
jgi:hypothetical protein